VASVSNELVLFGLCSLKSGQHLAETSRQATNFIMALGRIEIGQCSCLGELRRCLRQRLKWLRQLDRNHPSSQCPKGSDEKCQESELQAEIVEHSVALGEGLPNLNGAATGYANGDDLEIEFSHRRRVNRSPKTTEGNQVIERGDGQMGTGVEAQYLS